MMQEYSHGGDDREVVAQAEVVESGAFVSGQIVDDADRTAGRVFRKYQRAS